MKDPLSMESYKTESDLKDLLLDPQVREGTYFEFKEDFTSDVQKKLGKHVAAFANSYGGLLAIGVKGSRWSGDSTSWNCNPEVRLRGLSSSKNRLKGASDSPLFYKARPSRSQPADCPYPG